MFKAKVLPVAISLVFGGLGPAYAEIVLKVSAFTPRANPIFTCGVVPMIEELEAHPGVTVEGYYGGGAFGNAERQYDQVSRGVTDIAFGITSYTEGQFPLTEIISMPFVVDDHVEGSRILNDVLLPEFLQDEYSGVKPIHLWMTSLYQLHMRNEIADPTNLTGLRIRSAGDVNISALQALGAQVVFLPAPQIYEVLQKGVIDGTHSNWTTTIAFKVGEVTNHHYVVNMGTSVGFTFINENTYQSLPDDVKAIIDKHSGTEASMKVSDCFNRTDGVAVTTANGTRNVVHQPTSEQRATMADKVMPVIQTEIDALEARGIPAQALYDRIVEERSR